MVSQFRALYERHSSIVVLDFISISIDYFFYGGYCPMNENKSSSQTTNTCAMHMQPLHKIYLCAHNNEWSNCSQCYCVQCTPIIREKRVKYFFDSEMRIRPNIILLKMRLKKV